MGRAEKAFLLLLALYGAAAVTPIGPATRLLLALALFASVGVVGVKWLREGIRRVIWSLRYRLLVAYLFIAVVPIVLIAILAGTASWAISGQVAIYLVSSELDRRIAAMDRAARALANTPEGQWGVVWERMAVVLREDFPRLAVLLERSGSVVFPPDPEIEPPPSAWSDTSGLVVRQGLAYAWARVSGGPVTVTLMAPVTRRFLLSLAPGLGDVTILEFTEDEGGSGGVREVRPHDPIPGEAVTAGSAVPPPRNRFDRTFQQAVVVPVHVWEAPGAAEQGLLSVRSRFSALQDVIYSRQTSTGVLLLLYLAAVVFLLVELVSLVIGVSITRTITSAFSGLYEATQRISGGDFSHRIEVRGSDQLAAVSVSFNHMTEQVQRLLAVAKENERMTAELEIAREVQRQLYPKSVPSLPKLELRAICNPARMVSGDYYDYQALRGRSAVVAVGDVAGKGISAALLMATLQASLRTHVRSCLEGSYGGDTGPVPMSTSRLVSQLNQQLYADTSPEKYATFFFAIYNDDSGELAYTNAGHLPPVLLRRGEVIPLEVNGMVVGAFPFAQYGESRLRLESGDLLLAFTDGITEPENEYGEMFGEQRVIDLMRRNAGRDVDAIIGAVMEAVRDWTGSPELQDDMTILVARRR